MATSILWRRQKTAVEGGRMMLVSVSVVGSTGPNRFVTNERETVAAVVETTLHRYAHERRFPFLGCDVGEFWLFCAQSYNMEPLDPSEPVGANGRWNFVLCKKGLNTSAQAGAGAVHAAAAERLGCSGGLWIACLGNSKVRSRR